MKILNHIRHIMLICSYMPYMVQKIYHLKIYTTKSFESWIIDDVESFFDIQEVKSHILLKKWLETEMTIPANKKELLDIYRDKLSNHINFWNEDELKMNFISPFLFSVDFITNKYKAFSQRSLTLKTDKIETSGIVDYMIATGRSRPKEPLLFIHEYKQQRSSKKNDPLGQLLIAMIAAQLKNNNQEPIYGVLVEGRSWYFVILKDKEYSVSNIYDACTDTIYQIYSILCKAKEYFEEILDKQK